MELRRHVCLRCPHFLFPWGFQSKAWLVTFDVSFLKVCPIHCNFLLQIWISVDFWLALFHSSEFCTMSAHSSLRICRRHLLRKVWTLMVLLEVTIHVLEPYSGTDLMLELKIHIFVHDEINGSGLPEWPECGNGLPSLLDPGCNILICTS